MPTSQPAPRLRIWDIPTRLFHWLLVGLIGFSWWSAEQHEMDWHRLSGITILGLLIFRIYWGFMGGRTARFAQFVRGPRAAFAYLAALFRGKHQPGVGHNPVGGWSVILMLLGLLAMVTAGLFSVDVDGLESGPLADYISFDQGRTAAHFHGFMFNVLLALIGVHIVAITVYLVLLRQNLIGPMIHGHRRATPGETIEHVSAPLWKALLGIVIAAGCAYAVSKGFRF